MKLLLKIPKLHNKQRKPESRDYETMRPMRWINIAGILIVLCTVSITAWFVYTNIYKTIGTVQSLLIIKAEPDFEPVNFKLYNETKESWEKKYSTTSTDSLRDPFHVMTTSTISTTTTSTVEIKQQPQNPTEISL